jgi:hypothetical protein
VGIYPLHISKMAVESASAARVWSGSFSRTARAAAGA